MTDFSPEEVLNNPQSEALAEELKHWTLTIPAKTSRTIEEVLEEAFGENWREQDEK